MSSSAAAIPAETPLLSASRLISQALSLIKDSPDSAPSQDAISQLQLSLDVLTKLDPYIESHSAAPPAAFNALAEATVSEDWDARYKEGKTAFPLGAQFSAGAYEGMFVAQVAKSIRAKRVLEVGMFTGTTTLCVADQLPAGGKIIALEIDAYLKDFLQPHSEKSGVAEKIEVMTGKAKDSIETLLKEIQSGKAEPFDLIFIDADKEGYQGYFDQIINGGMLAKSGTLLCDNTLYSEWTRGCFLGTTDGQRLTPHPHFARTHHRGLSIPRGRLTRN
jgi:caffeoyl-CoA O-methyltransferase